LYLEHTYLGELSLRAQLCTMGQSEGNFGIDLTGSGEGGVGNETNRNDINIQSDDLKASLDNSCGHTIEHHCGDSGRSEASGSESLIDVSELGSGMSTTSEVYYSSYEDSEFDFDISVHSEFIPISKNVHRERLSLRLRSKSTSDLTEGW